MSLLRSFKLGVILYSTKISSRWDLILAPQERNIGRKYNTPFNESPVGVIFYWFRTIMIANLSEQVIFIPTHF